MWYLVGPATSLCKISCSAFLQRTTVKSRFGTSKRTSCLVIPNLYWLASHLSAQSQIQPLSEHLPQLGPWVRASLLNLNAESDYRAVIYVINLWPLHFRRPLQTNPLRRTFQLWWPPNVISREFVRQRYSNLAEANSTIRTDESSQGQESKHTTTKYYGYIRPVSDQTISKISQAHKQLNLVKSCNRQIRATALEPILCRHHPHRLWLVVAT